MKGAISCACCLVLLWAVLLLETRAANDLEISMYDFNFVQSGGSDTDINLDVIGIDIIKNEGGTEVLQSVTHQKTVTEKFSFVHYTQTNYVTGWGFGLDLSFDIYGVGVSLSFEAGMESGWGEGVGVPKSVSREVDVVSSRQISVPPYTSVQACSSVTSSGNFTMDYSAKARHRFSPNRGSLQSLQGFRKKLIDQYGFSGAAVILERDSVVTLMSGNVTGNIALSTQFFVSPHEEGSSTSCQDLQRAVRRRKELSRGGNYTGDEKARVEGEIQLILHNLRNPRKKPKSQEEK